MQRRNVRGCDLTPDPSQHVGMLNAEKCVRYLRAIGVEIDDATADAWLDTQGTYRFLRSERTLWRLVDRWSCRCGEMIGYSERGRGRKRLKRDKNAPRPRPVCESCGTSWCSRAFVFGVRRNGTVADSRRGVDAVVPLRLDEWAGGL